MNTQQKTIYDEGFRLMHLLEDKGFETLSDLHAEAFFLLDMNLTNFYDIENDDYLVNECLSEVEAVLNDFGDF